MIIIKNKLLHKYVSIIIFDSKINIYHNIFQHIFNKRLLY